MEYIDMKNSWDSKPHIYSICSIRIRSRNWAITKKLNFKLLLQFWNKRVIPLIVGAKKVQHEFDFEHSPRRFNRLEAKPQGNVKVFSVRVIIFFTIDNFRFPKKARKNKTETSSSSFSEYLPSNVAIGWWSLYWWVGSKVPSFFERISFSWTSSNRTYRYEK